MHEEGRNCCGGNEPHGNSLKILREDRYRTCVRCSESQYFPHKGALPSGESAFFCLASRPYFPAVSLRSQSTGWLRRSVPYGRTVSFFSHLCSGSVRRRKSIPCFGKLRSAALVHGKGGAETMGFCRRSLESTSLYPPQADTARCFEEVSRFPCHNVAGNRLTRRCRLSAAIGRKLPSGAKHKNTPTK